MISKTYCIFTAKFGLAENRPTRDLYITGDHALYLKGVLIPIGTDQSPLDRLGRAGPSGGILPPRTRQPRCDSCGACGGGELPGGAAGGQPRHYARQPPDLPKTDLCLDSVTVLLGHSLILMSGLTSRRNPKSRVVRTSEPGHATTVTVLNTPKERKHGQPHPFWRLTLLRRCWQLLHALQVEPGPGVAAPVAGFRLHRVQKAGSIVSRG